MAKADPSCFAVDLTTDANRSLVGSIVLKLTLELQDRRSSILYSIDALFPRNQGRAGVSLLSLLKVLFICLHLVNINEEDILI